eukprot:1826499-Pyramimonas_sp.AAC.1
MRIFLSGTFPTSDWCIIIINEHIIPVWDVLIGYPLSLAQVKVYEDVSPDECIKLPYMVCTASDDWPIVRIYPHVLHLIGPS